MHVLFVDDDSFNTLIAKKLFAKMQIIDKVVFVTNGDEALTYMMRDTNILPTHVFLDQHMPVMSGSEFLSQLKENKFQLENTKILLMTSSDSLPEFKHPSLMSMINYSLNRPLQLSILEEILGIGVSKNA